MQDSTNPKLHYYHYGVDQLAYFDSGKGKQPTVLLIHGLEKIIPYGMLKLLFYLSIIG
jgi:hypothetical protein